MADMGPSTDAVETTCDGPGGRAGGPPIDRARQAHSQHRRRTLLLCPTACKSPRDGKVLVTMPPSARQAKGSRFLKRARTASVCGLGTAGVSGGAQSHFHDPPGGRTHRAQWRHLRRRWPTAPWRRTLSPSPSPAASGFRPDGKFIGPGAGLGSGRRPVPNPTRWCSQKRRLLVAARVNGTHPGLRQDGKWLTEYHQFTIPAGGHQQENDALRHRIQ